MQVKKSLNIIQIKNLVKIYDGCAVLDDINFTIKKGEFVVITGDSGSGKSTLLQIIGLMDKLSTGEYFLDGNPVHDQHLTQMARARHRYIGFIFQRYHLIPHLNVLENILLPLEYGRHADKKEKAIHLLQSFDMKNCERKYPNQLSYGQQQRVATLRALITNPDLILADEPTGALDEKNSHMLVDTLHQLNSEGKTVVLITHNHNLIQKGDAHYHLKSGKLEKIK